MVTRQQATSRAPNWNTALACLGIMRLSLARLLPSPTRPLTRPRIWPYSGWLGRLSNHGGVERSLAKFKRYCNRDPPVDVSHSPHPPCSALTLSVQTSAQPRGRSAPRPTRPRLASTATPKSSPSQSHKEHRRWGRDSVGADNRPCSTPLTVSRTLRTSQSPWSVLEVYGECHNRRTATDSRYEGNP